jgi:hypothetical protein
MDVSSTRHDLVSTDGVLQQPAQSLQNSVEPPTFLPELPLKLRTRVAQYHLKQGRILTPHGGLSRACWRGDERLKEYDDLSPEEGATKGLEYGWKFRFELIPTQAAMFTGIDGDTTGIIENIRTKEIAGFHSKDLTEMLYYSNKDNIVYVENIKTVLETLHTLDRWASVNYHAESGLAMLVDFKWLLPPAGTPDAPSVAWLIRTYFWKCNQVIIAFGVPDGKAAQRTEPELAPLPQQEFEGMP